MGAAASQASIINSTHSHEPVLLATPRRAVAWADVDHSFSGSSFVLAKERIQCLCEGGQHCVKEDPDCQEPASAFQGLHSSWVTPQVLAMARPWQENLLKHNIAHTLQVAGVGMILNLQEVGEHAHCGRGVLPCCGFSYDPETFMAAGIGVYNFSWRDMGTPTLHKMMDIVQVMAHVTQEERRKVAVHCHAGLGRTGLAIACYLVFLGECDASEAVLRVRRGRPGALQTHQQEHFVEVFHMYLTHLRCIFLTPETGFAAAVASTTHAPDSAADKRSASYSPVHRLHLASSSPAAGGHAAGSTPEELQSVSAVARGTPSDAQLQPATAERWGAAETAEPEAPAAAGVEASGEAAAAALGLAGDPVTVRDGQQGAAWAEQPVCSTAGSLEDSAFVGQDLTPGYPRLNHEVRGDPVLGSARQDAAVATAGSLEDSAFVGHDLGVSISAGQDAEVATAAGQRQGRFRVPWLMARGGSKAAKVHASSPARSAASRLDVLWSEDGFIKAGSRHKLHEGQAYRASPPGHLQEALARQRRLLHGQELRDYWNLPKVIDMIAAALENAANGQDATIGSLAAQLADARSCDADPAVVQAAQAVALEVNSSMWDSLLAASPAALMQLLQLWFQTFQEPVLSISQQQTILSILGSYTDSNTGSYAVSSSTSHLTQDAGQFELPASELPTGTALADPRPSDAEEQQQADQCAAVSEHLSVPQKALIARLVKCFRRIAAVQADNSSCNWLMQWLAKALTVPHMGMDTSDALSKEQAALVSFLTHGHVSLWSVKTMHQAVAHAAVVAEDPQTTTAAVSDIQKHQFRAPDQDIPVLVDAKDERSVAAEGKPCMPEKESLQDTGSSPEKMTSKSYHRGWDTDDQGCLWLHSRLAKRAWARFNSQAPNSQAQTL